MAHHQHSHGTQNGTSSRRPSMVGMARNDQAAKEGYDYELMKLLEQERLFTMKQQQLARDNAAAQSQHTQYIPSIDEIYANAPQQHQGMPQLNQPVLSVSPPDVPRHLSPVKPLRIVIIRHAERADAVLGSEWSKKSFDRQGRYIRFSEHLPDALPSRSYLHHYVIDVPLTNRGRVHAYRTGKALLLNGYSADICYTSPSLRCVQSADRILSGMGRKNVSMQLEPGLFECYLNDFKRTLCFMTKDELASNGYNIDRRYKALMPFMRPHDSQADYYERCQVIMDVITKRHEATGGTILIVAHAPSLEGLTRHFSGGKYLPEKLFDIARRVPFLAMTIVERNSIDGPWLFRAQPLQTAQTELMTDAELEMPPPSSVATTITHHHPMSQRGHPPIQHQQPLQPHPSQLPTGPMHAQQPQQQQQRLSQVENLRHPHPSTGIMPSDSKKVHKSSTVPNLPTDSSFADMFRVI